MSALERGDVSPMWLGSVLRAAGARIGGIRRLSVEDTGAFNSQTVRLRIVWDADAPQVAPTSVILKRPTEAEWSIAGGRDEVTFYELVRSLADHPPGIVPCYAAEIDPVTGGSFVLLTDVGATHVAPVTRDDSIHLDGVPADEHLDAIVDTLAGIHAYWWGRTPPDGMITGHWSADDARFDAYLTRRSAAWNRVRTAHAELLGPELIAFYDRLLARLPHYWTRFLRTRMSDRRDLTMIHGDAYASNFLVPRSGIGATYLLDWQSPTFDIGALDLANLCATFWTRTQRREHDREHRVLARYHHGLLAGGVRGYDMATLYDDYRRALISWVLVPVQDAGDGSAASYWRPKMGCLAAAYQDWDCDRWIATRGWLPDVRSDSDASTATASDDRR